MKENPHDSPQPVSEKIKQIVEDLKCLGAMGLTVLLASLGGFIDIENAETRQMEEDMNLDPNQSNE